MPTREKMSARNSVSNIDHILMRLNKDVINSCVVQSNISDHYSLLFSLENDNVSIPSHITPETLSFIDNNKVNILISNKNWDIILNETSAHRMYDKF